MESSNISQSQRKGPLNMAVALHACFVTGTFYVKARLCRSQWLKCNCYIIFIMSSKSIHRTSNKKFSDFMQHRQIKICEASHFCIILELVAYKLIFLSKQTSICVTKTARNVHFGNMKFSWKK